MCVRIVKGGGGAEGRWEWGGLVDAWLCPPMHKIVALLVAGITGEECTCGRA